MLQNTLYPAIGAAYRALADIYAPVIEKCSQEYGLSIRAIFILLTAPTFEPKAVSAELLNIRSPYTAPEYYSSILQELAHLGVLYPENEGQYRITKRGLEIIKKSLAAIYRAMGEIQSFPLVKQMDLASRLKILADHCLAAPDPPGTWCIRHVRRMDPGTRVPMMARIDQFLSELQAFRDDAHLAAWRGIESNGHAWDILTQMWREGKSNPEKIFQALARRGYSHEQSRRAVELLLRRGWITREGESLQITSFGSEIRQNAEIATERYFHAPFARISANEMKQTIALMVEFSRDLSINAGRQ